MVWPLYDPSELEPIEIRYQIRNHDITILLGNQMLEQTIKINTFSKNSNKINTFSLGFKSSGRLSKQSVTRT